MTRIREFLKYSWTICAAQPKAGPVNCRKNQVQYLPMPTNLRKFAAQTNFRLVAGGLLLLFIGGPLLIGWLYGPGAAVTALLCLLGSLLPLGLIALAMLGLDWLVRKNNS